MKSSQIVCAVKNETRTHVSIKEIEKLVEEAARNAYGGGERRGRKMKILPFFVTLYIVGPKRSGELNKTLRGKDEPADVLSLEYPNVRAFGEIFVCPAVIRRKVRAEKKMFSDEFAHAVVHGVFHILGVHHEKSAEVARQLMKKENEVLKKLGYKEAHNL